MKLSTSIILFLLHSSTFCADPNYFDQYYEDVVDRSLISVSFIGMTLTPKYLKEGCDPTSKTAKTTTNSGIQTLAVDEDDPGRDAMTSKMLTERFAPGILVSYIKHFNPLTSLNVEFQGLVKWHHQEYARSRNCKGGHIQIPFGPLTYCNEESDWNNAIFAYFRYETELNSIGFNILSHSSPVFFDYFTISASGGLRYILFSESLRIKAHAPPNLSCYHVTTDNNLIGLQMGGSFVYSSSKFYTWTLDLKGGVFANMISAHPQLFDDNNTVILFNEVVTERVLSYLAQFHSYSMYNITDSFFIETAYQGLVIWNLALARKFVTFTRDQSNIFTRSYRYYNSFLAGIGFRF